MMSSAVTREVHPEQAQVVRRIFDMYVAGAGYMKIAKTLNDEAVAPPRGDLNGWAHTAIREMIRRELYRGVDFYNRTQKVIRRGRKGQRDRDPSDWVRVEKPELRIVSDELWDAAQKRIAEVSQAFPRSADGRQLIGHPQGLDRESPYLLTGFATCAVCGNAMGGETGFHGNGPTATRKRVQRYGCLFHRKRGATICANDLTLGAEIADAAAISAIEAALDEQMIREAVDRALERLSARRTQHDAERTRLERERKTVEARLARLLQLLLDGDQALETVKAQMKADEQRKRQLDAALSQLDDVARIADVDRDRLRGLLMERVADLRGLFDSNTPKARQALRKIVVGKLLMEPVLVSGKRGYKISGQLAFGRLLPADLAFIEKPSDCGGPNGNSQADGFIVRIDTLALAA